MLSGHGESYSGPDKSLSPQWVICNEGDNFEAVNVMINETHVEMQNIENGNTEAVEAVVSAGLIPPTEIDVVR